MRIPTQTDEWTCYQIDWPKGEEYAYLLRAMLYELTRGRYYDAKTGNIRAAQSIGWQIFDRNLELNTCSTNPLPDAGSDESRQRCTPQGFGDGDSEEGDEMSNCITHLTIEDGKLIAHYGPCCEVEVGTLADLTPGAPTEEVAPVVPDAEEVTDWACRKAYAAGRLMEDVALQIVAHKSGLFWEFMNGLRSNVGYVSWSNSDMVGAWAEAFTFEQVLPGLELTWSSEDTELLICTWEKIMLDAPTSVNDAEFAAMRSTVNAQMSKGVQGAVWDHVLRAVGIGRVNDVIAGGIFDTEADCSCPEFNTVVPPVAYDWIHDVNFLVTNGGFSSAMEWAAGKGWGEDGTEQYDYMPQIQKEIAAGKFGTVNYVRLELEWPSNYADMAGNRRTFLVESIEIIGTEIWTGQPVVSKVVSGAFTEYDLMTFMQDWQFTHTNPIGGNRRIKRLTISGTGDDPFPDLPVG